MTRSRQAGFSLVELLVVVAIMGVMAALAMPQVFMIRDNARLRSVAREVSNAFQMARQRAIATGNNQVVFVNHLFGAPLGDLCGNILPIDPATGAPVAMLVLDDGPPGPGANCCIDAGETFTTVAPQPGLNWGMINAASPLPADDTGGGPVALGASFTQPGGAGSWWTVFRPDGLPVGAAFPTCALGSVGTGGGAVYINNTRRDYSVVLAPLGGVKVYTRTRGGAAWTN